MPQKITDSFTQSKIFPATVHDITLFIPDEYKPDTPAAVLVTQDQRDISDEMASVIKNGKMPVCIGIFVSSGRRPTVQPGTFDRSNRSEEYDSLGSGFPDFIVDEVIPYLQKKYQLNLSADPDMHMICGCSSGGISAFNAAWERNDYFRRVLIFSPTFCAFRGGDAFPIMVRKYETKKIRCLMTVGTEDMRNSAGDWHLEALRMADAFKFAGYDYLFNVYGGGTHGCGFGVPDAILWGLEWCWRNWQTEKVHALGLPPRVADMISLDTEWEPFEGPLPRKSSRADAYTFDGGCICRKAEDGTTVKVADGYGKITALAVSPDRWRLYIADAERRFVYVRSIQPNGSLTDPDKFAHLDLKDDFTVPGAFDLATDVQDRLYAATELGIQTFSSNSEHNCILELPQKRAAVQIVLTDEKQPYCYVKCADGTVFRRKWNVAGVTENTPITQPSTKSF